MFFATKSWYRMLKPRKYTVKTDEDFVVYKVMKELESYRKECDVLRERLTYFDENEKLENKSRFVSWISLPYVFMVTWLYYM